MRTMLHTKSLVQPVHQSQNSDHKWPYEVSHVNALQVVTLSPAFAFCPNPSAGATLLHILTSYHHQWTVCYSNRCSSNQVVLGPDPQKNQKEGLVPRLAIRGKSFKIIRSLELSFRPFHVSQI